MKHMNFYRGSFIDKRFDEYMKVEKFDVIVGNPPYQENYYDTGKSKGGGKGGSNNLWSKFILKSIEISDKICFINPPSFLSPKHDVLAGMLSNGGIRYLYIFEKSPFEGVGTKACYYLWERGYTRYTNTNSGNINLRNSILPNSSNVIDFSLFNKFFNQQNKIKFISNSKLHRTTKRNLLSDIKDDIYIYKVYHASKIIYSSIKTEEYDKGKIIVSDSGYLNPKYDVMCSTTQHSFFLIENDKIIAEKIISILNSKLYKYCLNKSKFSGFFHGEVLKNIPMIPLDREWTDSKLYEYFNLTIEEIDFIEKTII